MFGNVTFTVLGKFRALQALKYTRYRSIIYEIDFCKERLYRYFPPWKQWSLGGEKRQSRHFLIRREHLVKESYLVTQSHVMTYGILPSQPHPLRTNHKAWFLPCSSGSSCDTFSVRGQLTVQVGSFFKIHECQLSRLN